MRGRMLGALVVAIAVVSLGSGSIAGQTSSAPARAYTAPRTGDGQPDLQGTWSYATLTPLERPRELSSKEVLSEQEAAQFEKETLARRDNDRRTAHGLPTAADHRLCEFFARNLCRRLRY